MKNIIEKIYALTPMQEAMLFHSIEDDSNAYFCQSSYKIYGDFNIDFLQKSIDMLCERHDIFRTAFIYDKTEDPVQVVLRNRKADFSMEDISSMNKEDQLEYIRSYQQHQKDRGFDLTKDVLFKISVFKIEDNCYEFNWCYHHILIDGWCLSVLINELSTIYTALVKGETVQLAEPVPFRNYIKWLERQDKKETAEFWQNYLEGYQTDAKIPTQTDPTEQDMSVEPLLEVLTIDAVKTKKIEQLAKKYQTTTNAVFQAIWGVVLARQTFSKDVVYGNVVSGRPPELEGADQILGLFINTIPLRVQLDENTTFTQLLNQVHTDTIESLPYQHASLSNISGRLKGQHELANHVVAFENYLVEKADDEDGLFEIKDLQSFERTNFPLGIFVYIGEELCINTLHNPSFYPTAQVQQIGKDIEEVIDQVIVNAEVKVAELEFKSTGEWQSRFQEKEQQVLQTAYWMDKLADSPAIDLPVQREDTRTKSNQKSEITLHFDEVIFEEIKEFVKENNTTLYNTLLTVFKVLMYRYTAAQDVCLGSYLPAGTPAFLRTEIGQNPSFLQLLEKVGQTIQEASSNNSISIDEIKEGLNAQNALGASMSNSILFDMIEKNGEERIAAFQEAEVEMAFEIYPTHSMLKVAYNSDKYSEAMMQQLLSHYQALLNAALVAPKDAISEMRMLSAAEQKILLNEFNDTYFPIPADTTVVDLFEGYANTQPDAIAIDFQDRSITYKELSEQTNQLANFLLDNGVEKESLINICIDRSPEMIIAILGIIKAGAAYVPINPEYPTERIQFILENTQTRFVISNERSKERIPQLEGLNMVLLDEELTEIKTASIEKPAVKTQQDGLAYVIYTSGSTGNPKGVMMEHRGLLNIVQHYIRDYEITPEDHVFQFTSYTFDPSVAEIFMGLCAGSRLVITDDVTFKDSDKLIDYMKEKGVSVLTLAVAYATVLELEKLDRLRIINAGGEAANVNRAVECASFTNYYNAYGPTECAVCSTKYLAKLSDAGKPAIPIGKPVSNNEILILGADGELLPLFAEGEICIAGDCLARGYLFREDLTAAKFVAHPFKPGKRMYRTGDRGCWSPDGNLNFLGRNDDQVKVRGHRIELGEIESRLQKCDLVKEGVVLALDDGNGLKQLVAYVVSEGSLDTIGIRNTLLAQLPEFMVPHLIMDLPELPLTNNGKVNRKVLAAMDISEIGSQEFVEPVTATEKHLAEIWKKLLKVERVGISENFFEIGGHSLLATRLASAIRRELSVEISIKDIFDQSTILSLSTLIDRKKNYKTLPEISVMERPTNLPLSFSQERLWFIDKMQGSVNYHMPAVLKLEGEIKTDILEYAFREIINRHEVLRTIFREKAGQPYQVVLNKNEWSMNVRAAALPTDKEARETLINEEINRPFDLSIDHPIRVKMMPVSADENVLVVVMHHIASDGWSMSLFVKELIEIYQSKVEARNARVTDLTIQYADYALWQRAYLEGEVLETKLAYWEQKLAGVQPLDLLPDFIRPAIQSDKGAVLDFKIDKALAGELNELAKKEGVTLFMLLLAAFKVLLFRHSGQVDICVGSPIANRTHAAIEPLIGFFLNTLALRSNLDGNPAFRELLKEIKKTTLEAYSHQEVPFEKIVEKVTDERDMSRSPLFQVMFTLHNNPELPTLKFGNVQLSPQLFEQETSQFDISLDVTETKDGMELELEYCSDIFLPESAEQLLVHFKELLVSVVQNPTEKIERLNLLADTERSLLLGLQPTENGEWFNQPVKAFNNVDPINVCFEKIAEKTPTAIAVIHNGEEWTYTQLNEFANQIAHCLTDLGVAKGDFVGIYADRGVKLIAGLLAILKIGAAYVPLDPQNPVERIEKMLDSGNMKTVLTNGSLFGQLKTTQLVSAIFLENYNLNTDADAKLIIKDLTDIKQFAKNNPLNQNDLNSRAYVLYTSGSTGQPKGAINLHKGAMNHFLVEYDFMDNLKDDLRVLQSAGIGSDISVFQMLAPILRGGACVVIDKYDLLDYTKTVRLFEEAKVNLAVIVPSYAWGLIEFLKAQTNRPALSNLQWVMLGGEELPVTLANEWLDLYPNVRILNAYGPCETSDDVIQGEIKEKLDVRTIKVPLGNVLPNMNVLIIDKFGKLCPIGVAGELCITGDCVGAGYWNMPEQTAKSFVNNPFVETLGETMYRTGDLARWKHDGQIEFLGRMDKQVKVRGHRVELGEVEAFIRKIANGRAVSVAISKGNVGQEKLIAFVVADEQSESVTELEIQLKTACKNGLPVFMQPDFYCFLDKLPTNLSDKVDQKKLLRYFAAQEMTLTSDVTSYVAPQNETQEILCQIWKKLLCKEQVGIHNNFFELGGHSLLAMKMKAAVAAELEVDVEIKDFFIYKTVFELAGHIEKSAKGTVLPKIEKRNTENAIPLSFAQERLWFLDKLEGSVHYHMPAIFKLEGPLDKAALEFALNEIVNRHEVLRTVYTESNGAASQEILAKDQWKMAVTILEDSSEELLQAQIANSINQAFDLSAHHMMRAHLFQLSDESYQLVLVLHHIAADGWSEDIFIGEILELYQAKMANRQPNLQELSIQYADYATWQRTYLEGDLQEEGLAFWEEKLTGVEPLNLPIDFARPPIQSTKGTTTSFSLDKQISDQLEQLAKEENATIFMVMLSIFKILLYRYTGQQDICVGTPSANRNQQEIESLIGLFVNTLVLRSTINEQYSFRQFLGELKTTVLEASGHQHVPFEKIVNRVEKGRDMSRTPLFQAFFVQENDSDSGDMMMGDVKMSIDEHEADSAKFDLSFDFNTDETGINVSVEYCTDLFLPATIERMVSHFKTLAASIAIGPGEPIGKQAILSTYETNQLVGFNPAPTAYPEEKTVLAFFEEHAKNSATKKALVFQGKELTFGQLNEQANQFAHYLQANGIEEGNLVPILLDRSLEMIISILGVLKAGAAYVPIDPAYPADRIQFILEDTAASLLITSSVHQSIFEERLETKTILVDEDWTAIEKASSKNLPLAINPEQPAYIIYTSGSTGKPKGVIISHFSLCNRMLGESDLLKLDSNVTTYLMTNYVFDVSLLEIFLPMTLGGTLVVPASETIYQPDVLAAELAKEGVTKLQGTPSSLLNLLNALSDEQLDALQLELICVGGESLSTDLVEQVKNRLPKVQLNNHYGPTETTIDAIVLENVTSFDRNLIGKPIINTSIYIADVHQKLTPIGVVGEIFVGGTGVAMGYLNRPALTAEKFIPNPFSVLSNDKVYKTGDLGRWLPDGNIEFLGRKDDQVKVKGYRIELGEIEAVLQQSPEVDLAAVMVHKGAAGNKQLVAYVVAKEAYDRDAIYTWLKNRLPDYMVPSIMMELPEMPLTINGKINRKALPQPDVNSIVRTKYVAPRNEAEENLASVWKMLLGVEQVGIHDNYFEMGGDSIITIQIVSRAKRFGYQLKPRDLFQQQTIAELAEYLANNQAEELVAEQGVLTGELPLTPIQQEFLNQPFDSKSHYNQTLLLEVDKEQTEATWARLTNALTAQHDALRLTFKLENGEWQQAYGAVTDDLSVIDMTEVAADEAKIAITDLCNTYQQSLSIEKGRLFKAVLIKTPTSEQANRLLLVVHHLAIDGVSWRILLNDLSTGIEQLSAGQPIDLGSKTTSFRAWGEALTTYAKSPSIEAQQAYWTAVVDKFQPLPVDKKATRSLTKEALNYTNNFDSAYTQSLLKEVGRTKLEIEDFLLTSLLQAIADWSGREDLIVGLEGHGREEIGEGIDVTNTVGWFTNVYPLALQMKNDLSEIDLIRAVKEQRKAVPAKGMGFGLLRYLHPETSVRKALSNTKWDVEFNYLGQFDNAIDGDAKLAVADESTGESIAADYPLNSKLEINCSITDGQLDLTWTFPANVYEEKTIQNLANNFLIRLNALVASCQQSETVYPTVSDWGLAPAVTNEELDRFMELTDGQQSRRDTLESVYRLSPMQEGMLFHGLYDRNSQAYLEQSVYNFNHSIDVEAFKASWAALIKNHSILRTGIIEDAFGIPVQYVKKEVGLPFELLDYTEMNAEEQQFCFKMLLDDDLQKGIDLQKAPLLRLTLVKLSDEAYKLIWTTHHIILDGWSQPVLLLELFSHYEAVVKGLDVPQVKQDRYEDYIRYIAAKDTFEEAAFWNSYLSDFETPSLLPFVENKQDRNKGKGRAKDVMLTFDKDFTTKLKQVAQANFVTVNTVVQAVWSFLLAKYTANNDTLFGVTVSGRPTDMEASEERIGLFINTLPLRAKVELEQTIGEWLSTIQQGHTAAREYQYTSLSKAQKWSGVQGDFFDSILVYQNFPVGDALDQNWLLKPEAAEDNEQTNYVLSVVVGLKETMEVRFSYYEQQLTKASTQMIKGHFEQVLTQIVEQQAEQVADINFLTPAEREQLIVEFNDTDMAYSKDQSIVEVFQARVRENADKTAVVFGDQSISYRELDQRSNQLAACLQARGVEKQDKVGLLAYRGFDMIVSILGILKCGAIYVPLNIDYPTNRMQYILDDSAVNQLVFTSEELLDKSGLANLYDCVNMAAAAEFDLDAKAVSTTIEDGAYVMYTSGTTGEPKGILINQRNILKLAFEQKEIAINRDDHVLQWSNYSFDGSTYDIYSTLLNAATLYMITEKEATDPTSLSEIIRKNQLTVSFVTTALFNGFIDYDPEALTGLRRLLFGGELVSVPHVKKALAALGSDTLVHVYGPTETTVYATYYPIRSCENGRVPIGYPLSNTCTYVVDENGQLVSVGVVGELLIGGDGVSNGYPNRPDLTAEKFIPNPFDSEKAPVLYKTGDLVCRLADGTIDFVGRRDSQIKMRGYRIELGEVEMILQKSDLVNQCLVLAKADDNGNNKRLVAYIVPNGTFDRDAILAFLKVEMPEYMVPSVLIGLDAFPLNKNGKVDKAALPEPDASVAISSEYVAPRTEVESQLAEIWKELLNVERVGIHDNFFDLGGDSIITIQVVSRAKRLGFRLQPRDVFVHHTIAALSGIIKEETLASSGEQGLLKGDCELLPIQQWFFNDEYPAMEHFNHSTLLKIDKDVEVEALQEIAGALVAQHDALRFAYRKEAGQWMQAYSKQSGQLDVEDLSNCSEAELSEAITAVCRKYQVSLNLEEGILVRFVFIKTPDSAARNRFFIVINHVVVDDVSWRIIFDQLEQAMADYRAGKSIQLGGKSSSYRQWVNALRAHSTTDKITSQQKLWKTVADSYQAIPVDFEKEGLLSTNEENVTSELPADLTKALLQDINQTYQTNINDILLSALARTISEWAEMDKVVIGLEGHGREDIFDNIDLSSTIGWFTNLYPLGLSVKSKASEGQLIKSVKEQLRVIPDKGMGYGLLRYLHPEAEVRNQIAHSKWDIVFNYSGQFDGMMDGSTWYEEAKEDIGESVSELYPMKSKLAVNGLVMNGQLNLIWTFSTEQYKQATIERLAKAYIENLTLIIQHCLNKEQQELTPSDYGLNEEVSAEELEVFNQFLAETNLQGEDILKF